MTTRLRNQMSCRSEPVGHSHVHWFHFQSVDYVCFVTVIIIVCSAAFPVRHQIYYIICILMKLALVALWSSEMY